MVRLTLAASLLHKICVNLDRPHLNDVGRNAGAEVSEFALRLALTTGERGAPMQDKRLRLSKERNYRWARLPKMVRATTAAVQRGSPHNKFSVGFHSILPRHFNAFNYCRSWALPQPLNKTCEILFSA